MTEPRDGEREPIETRLAPAYDEPRIAATWNRIAAGRKRRREPKRVWLLAGAAAAAVAVATLFVAWPRTHRDQPLRSRDPFVSMVPGAVWTHDVKLDDNSTVALTTGSRLQVLANEGTRFSTLLERGSAHFDVQPGGPRRWEIETSLASVEVVGTAFTVALDDHGLVVSVDRGVVMVHGERVPGRVVRLGAGERITVGSQVAVAPSPPPSVVAPPTAAEPRIATSPASPKPSASIAAPSVESTAVPPTPPAPAPTVVQPSIASVVAEADRLSSAGDPAAAAALLERVRARDGARVSGLVPFTLGRLYLDALGKPELAAAAFAEVIAGGKPRSLIEDAYARRVEALLRAGMRERATAALVDYEHAYPQGRRLAALHKLVSTP